jgi:hypothetical protein
MTVTVKVLIPAKQAENVQTTQYTASNCKTIIDKITATNTSASNVSISVNLVTSGGSPGTSNLITDTRNISPDETYTFPERVYLHHCQCRGIAYNSCKRARNNLTFML